jgi:hypothetical protein
MGWGLCCICLPLMILIAGVLAAPAALGIREVFLGLRSGKRRRVVMGAALLGTSVVLTVIVTVKPAQSARFCVQAPYLPPPATFEDEDLVGTWRAHYDDSIDTLILKPDGTFKQIYEDRYDEDYVYETPWSGWWVERYADGRVRVYLEGARFYEEGTTVAEEGGRYRDWTFYDQVAGELVTIPDMLVLNLRMDSSGEPLLLHVWSGPGETFALLGCERNVFRLVEAS